MRRKERQNRMDIALPLFKKKKKITMINFACLILYFSVHSLACVFLAHYISL